MLFSSICFIADSVFSGMSTILYASKRGDFGTERRGYLGARLSLRVFGRKKWVLVRTCLTLSPLVPRRTALEVRWLAALEYLFSVGSLLDFLGWSSLGGCSSLG